MKTIGTGHFISRDQGQGAILRFVGEKKAKPQFFTCKKCKENFSEENFHTTAYLCDICAEMEIKKRQNERLGKLCRP